MKPAQRAAASRRRGPWFCQGGPAVDDTCPRCAEPVVTFPGTDEHAGRDVVLDDHDVAITRDLLEVDEHGARLIDRTWTHHGDAGWVPTVSRRRTWRRVRAEHRCPTREHENKKENQHEC